MLKAVAAELLDNTIFATDLDFDERAALAQNMFARDVADGETVVSAGERTRTLYVLLEGRMKVSVAVQGGTRRP
ncbi:MAG: hypothetical protein AAGE01_00135 [Pseudomonadota bacterium]